MLLQCLVKGEIQELQELTISARNEEVDYDVRDEAGMSLLHHAARWSLTRLLQWLLADPAGPQLRAHVTFFSID